MRLDQIVRWAACAQIAPHDMLSNDRQTWVKAPMVPQLGMDWLVELTSEHYYGPTTVGALQEFVRLGEIDSETVVINTCDGVRLKIGQMPQVWKGTQRDADADQIEIQLGDPAAPSVGSMSVRLHQRIRDLEQMLQEERRALLESEQRYRDLERKYQELLEHLNP